MVFIIKNIYIYNSIHIYITHISHFMYFIDMYCSVFKKSAVVRDQFFPQIIDFFWL